MEKNTTYTPEKGLCMEMAITTFFLSHPSKTIELRKSTKSSKFRAWYGGTHP
jgi:hypothetical protein